MNFTDLATIIGLGLIIFALIGFGILGIVSVIGG